MADPNIAINLTIQNEGGWVNDPFDSGHETNMGITQADMPSVNLKELTPVQAAAYYRANYWKTYFSQIANQSVGNKIFDMGVLFGVETMIQLLQHTLGIKQDGVFGPDTLQAVNDEDSEELLYLFKGSLKAHAMAIVAKNPKDKKFLQGWLNRVNK